jgi:hypothetical protein
MAMLLMDDGGAFELDASGRIVAPAQTVIATREPGPWTSNGPRPVHVECAWCNGVMVEGDRSKPTSHGICAGCIHKFDEVTA